MKMGLHYRFVSWCFIFILSILLYQYSAIEASSNIEDPDLYDRVSKIEAKDRHQDVEISLLKNALNEEKKLVHELKSRLTILEDSNKTFGRLKRPVRLLPPHILYGERNKTDADDEKNRRFYGPATGCNDLGKLGYTLNGYYLVHGKEIQAASSNSSPADIFSQIEIVECRFRQKPKIGNQTDDKEKRLGFIRINGNNDSNNDLNEREDCLYRFKNNRQVSCLVAEKRGSKQSGNLKTANNPGFRLIQLPCDLVNTEEQLWTIKNKHICSNKNDKCLTVSPSTKEGQVFLNLMAYEASAKSQQWTINWHAVNGALTIVNVGTSLCLYDSAKDYEKMNAVNASTTVRRCDKGSSVFAENMFFLDLITINNHQKCALLEYANVDRKEKEKN